MSANIYWKPAKSKRFDLNIGAPSSFMEYMEKAFGSQTPTLQSGDIPVLRGMKSVASRDLGSVFDELIEAIETHDCIEMSAEY